MLQQLPSELLLHIFQALPPQSLHILAKLDRRFCQLANRLGAYQFDFTTIQNDQVGEKKEVMIKQMIPTFQLGDRVRHILIIDHTYLSNKVFIYLQQRCPNIISFDYDPEVLDTVTRPIQSWMRHPFLSSDLGWRCIKHLPACHDPRMVMWNKASYLFQQLESLHISPSHRFFIGSRLSPGWYVKLTMPPMPRLERLTLHVKQKISLKIIRYLHTQCPRLTSLTLRELEFNKYFRLLCNQSPSHQINIKKSIMPNLHTLTLENVTFEDLHPQSYTHFTIMYPNLHTLTLSPPKRHQNNPVSGVCIIKLMYDLVVRCKHLQKLVVRLDTTDPRNGLCNTWLKHKLEHYYSHPSRQHVLVQFIQV